MTSLGIVGSGESLTGLSQGSLRGIQGRLKAAPHWEGLFQGQVPVAGAPRTAHQRGEAEAAPAPGRGCERLGALSRGCYIKSQGWGAW